ncbi:MAG: hypothetical protein AAFN10_26040 [Bacteroidota bacterium]
MKRLNHQVIPYERREVWDLSIFALLAFCILLSACEPKPLVVPKPQAPPKDKKGIVFLGHIYRGGNREKVDERIETLNRDCYEHIWLGGDICAETTEKRETLDYLDDLFDLASPNTLWAYGNHDIRNGNHDWLREVTGRELHYVQNYPGMTVLVTNTNYKGDTECDQWLDQFDMIQNVCDTISEATHLFVLSHHLTWTDVEPDMNAQTAGNAGGSWLPYKCAPLTQFRFVVYPLLQQVQARGVQVVVIAGDAGQRDKFYQHQTTDGIWFLASGINNSTEPNLEKRAQLPKDRILYLDYEQENGLLDWQFLDLDSLLLTQE